MNTPPPVDTNLSALKNILANAKKVMNKVEGDKPIVQKSGQKGLMESNIRADEPIYDERDEREPEYLQHLPDQQGQTNIHQNSDYTPEQVMKSNLPPAIKEAMIKQHIPRISGLPSKFSLADLGDLDGLVDKKPAKQVRKPLQENSSNQSGMIMVSPTQLQSMINEAVNNHFKDIYDKRITEETIKKTINVLIKEGKINIKKK